MQTQSTDHDLSPESFAGLLSALTASKSRHPEIASLESWTDNLKEDVATLSYERALQNHARYKGNELPSASTPALHASAQSNIAAQRPSGAAEELPTIHANTAKNLRQNDKTQPKKNASVTLRMSAAELVQLQQRAAEANLSLSAYMRSCALEVEALRSQVKEALAALRNQSTAAQHAEPPAQNWLRLLFRKKSQ